MSGKLSDDELISLARKVLDIEARAVSSIAGRLGDDFARACRLLHATPGRVVVTGMGKSGLVGRKISATLASTGTPSLFLHAAEASHVDKAGVLQRVTVGARGIDKRVFEGERADRRFQASAHEAASKMSEAWNTGPS